MTKLEIPNRNESLFLRLSLAALTCTLVLPVARSQTLPSGIINSPPTVIGDNESIGSNTTLNLFDGVRIRDLRAGALDGTSTNVVVNIFDAVVSFPSARSGSTINVFGGGAFITSSAGSTVNLFDGIVRPTRVGAGSTINISGGVAGSFTLYKDATVNLSGGNIEDGLRVTGGALNMTGGTIGADSLFGDGAKTTITGGNVGRNSWVLDDGNVEIAGSDFRLNGVPYTGSSVNLDGDYIFDGVMADGTPFVFSNLAVDRIPELKLRHTPPTTYNTTPLAVDATNYVVPNGLRPGQSLTLLGGILPRVFSVVESTLVVEDGVGANVELLGSVLKMSGGHLGETDLFPGSSADLAGGLVNTLYVQDGVSVDIRGDQRISQIYAYSGSTINFKGPDFNNRITAAPGSTVNISSGSVRGGSGKGSTFNVTGGSFYALPSLSASFNMSGGTARGTYHVTPGNAFHLSGGTFIGELRAHDGSEVDLFGREFFLDGIPVELRVGETLEILDRNRILSGTLADGSPFEFNLRMTIPVQNDGKSYFYSAARLTVTRVPEPRTLALILFFLVPLFLIGSRVERHNEVT